MTRLTRMVVSLLLALALVAGSVATALAAAPRPVTDVSAQAARVQAFKEIVAQVKASNPDYAAILVAYREKLQPLVKARDAEFNDKLDQYITAALEAARTGQLKPAAAAQMVDKLLQKAFALTIRHAFVEAKAHIKADRQKALHEIDEAIAYFEALRGTVQKRDQAFGTQMEAAIDTALAEAQKAVQEGNEELLYFLQPLVTHNLVRTFYLAVTGYAKRVQDDFAAGKDVAGPMAEGWAFFQSIAGNVGKKTPDLAAYVEARLNPVQGNPALVRADEIRAALSAGLAGYVVHEVESSLQKWDTLDRLHTAAEGVVIAQAIEAHLGEVLGAQAQGQFQAAYEAFAQAARAKDRAGAEAAGQVLVRLSNEFRAKLVAADPAVTQLTIGQALIKSRGKWIAADVAPFIQNDRTVVPVRFVAEALGAQVEWLAEAYTVRITLGAKVILLPVGKAQATVDGAAYNLDVPAFIQNNRTFVPLRFVREALGATVQWDDATRTVTIVH